MRYDPFGVVRAGTPPDHGFTGENWDPSTGLVHLRARWYDPAHGTFTTRDPFPGSPLLPASQHPYQYAHNSPLQYTDPSGQCIGLLGGADTVFCAMVAGAVINTAINYGSQVYRNYQHGQRGWDMFTQICVDELLIAAASGAAMGAVFFVLAPIMAPLAALGPIGAFFAGASEGALTNSAGTIVSNLLSGRPWSTGVRESYVRGWFGGGLLRAGGSMLKGWWQAGRRTEYAKGDGFFFDETTYPYDPRGRVIPQTLADACVAASCWMILSDHGIEVPEMYVRGALGIQGKGGFLSDVPAALRELGLSTRYAYRAHLSINKLLKATARGPAIVNVKKPSYGIHAFVVDGFEQVLVNDVRRTLVLIRDPLPEGWGAAYKVDIADFMRAWQAAKRPAVIRPSAIEALFQRLIGQ